MENRSYLPILTNGSLLVLATGHPKVSRSACASFRTRYLTVLCMEHQWNMVDSATFDDDGKMKTRSAQATYRDYQQDHHQLVRQGTENLRGVHL